MRDLQQALIDRAEAEADTVMPGFTHLQIAQPVTLGHHLMAYVEMVGRDRGRLADCRRRLNELPLGAAALAGTSFPIDREATAAALGFDRPTANSLDAVSDRDFAIEFLAAAALAGTHLSRFAEEIVLWCSDGFGFVALSDAFTTGSSIMPQKRNPDAAELVRAKTGRLNGALIALLTVMKGLPLAYGKDMQEDKIPVFEAADALELCLAATAGMVRDLRPDRERLRAAAGRGFATATDLADWLVRVAGLPFRQRPPRDRPDRQARRGAGLRPSPSCRSPSCRRSSRRSPPAVYDVLDADALGRQPHQLWRHRPRPGPRRRRRGAQEVSADEARRLAIVAGLRSSASARTPGRDGPAAPSRCCSSRSELAGCGKKGAPDPPPGCPTPIRGPIRVSEILSTIAAASCTPRRSRSRQIADGGRHAVLSLFGRRVRRALSALCRAPSPPERAADLLCGQGQFQPGRAAPVRRARRRRRCRLRGRAAARARRRHPARAHRLLRRRQDRAGDGGGARRRHPSDQCRVGPGAARC